MYDTTDFRKGLKIEYKGEPYIIVDFQHVKPGKGVAFVKTRLKNLITGNVIDEVFRSGDKVGKPDLEEKHAQYLYKDGTSYYFMDTETYDQFFIEENILGDTRFYLKENIEVDILFYKERPISVELPNFVELKVTETDPGIKGDTVSGGSKPAITETGLKVQVPLFINEGDIIKVDTRSGEYIERV